MCHVLIIEDEALVAMDLQNVLSEAGATSFAFASSETEAVEQACARLPHVMTSDVQLLSGTGPAAVAIIRNRLGMIPVLFVSGNPADCGRQGPRDTVFSKPFDRVDLTSAFRKILSDGKDRLPVGA
jgi:CheY-like chemotaxis protein